MGIWVIRVEMTDKWGEIQGKLDLVWIIGEFNLSEFELSGFYHSNKMGWNFCFRKDISLNFRQVRTPLRQIRKAARKTLCWLQISLNTAQIFCLNQPQLSELSCKPTK